MAAPISDSHAQSSNAPLAPQIAACDAGDKAACRTAGLMLSDPQSANFDMFTSLRYLQNACLAMDGAACGRLALIYFEGKGDVDKDLSAAANFSQTACNENDRDGCDVAEAIFAESSSPFFDAIRALRYRKINCDFGRWQSCMQHARILHNIGDYRNAEQIAANACNTGGTERQESCDFATALKSRRIKMEQAAAQERASQQAAAQTARDNKRAVLDSFLRDRDYDGAIYAAIYNSRTVADAEYALKATVSAGAIGGVYIDSLHVLDYWIPSGNLNRIVNAEIARRSSGNDCGIFNCTNMPGASAKRWSAANGNRSASNYRPRSASSSGGSGQSVLSTSDAQRQTREKYRSAHCTMNNNANRNVC